MKNNHLNQQVVLLAKLIIVIIGVSVLFVFYQAYKTNQYIILKPHSALKFKK